MKEKKNRHKEHRTRQEVSEAGAVVFPDAVENHRPGGHIHSHRECLSGKKHLGYEEKMKRETMQLKHGCP